MAEPGFNQTQTLSGFKELAHYHSRYPHCFHVLTRDSTEREPVLSFTFNTLSLQLIYLVDIGSLAKEGVCIPFAPCLFLLG